MELFNEIQTETCFTNGIPIFLHFLEKMNNFRVIIIGAGAAGIAAAARLLENNVRHILILEAEDRIGGRIFTSQIGI